MKLCNYGNTSISWTAKHDSTDNRKPGHMPRDKSIRILIDSRTQIINLETGDSEWFYLITPCRTEWMYRDDVLFKNDPNLEFVGIYSALGNLIEDAGFSVVNLSISSIILSFLHSIRYRHGSRLYINIYCILLITCFAHEHICRVYFN